MWRKIPKMNSNLASKPLSIMSTIHKDLIIPDTTMDIMIDINIKDNKIKDIFSCIFDKGFMNSGNSSNEICFGISFFAWTTFIFTDANMSKVFNNSFTVESYFNSYEKETRESMYETTIIAIMVNSFLVQNTYARMQ